MRQWGNSLWLRVVRICRIVYVLTRQRTKPLSGHPRLFDQDLFTAALVSIYTCSTPSTPTRTFPLNKYLHKEFLLKHHFQRWLLFPYCLFFQDVLSFSSGDRRAILNIIDLFFETLGDFLRKSRWGRSVGLLSRDTRWTILLLLVSLSKQKIKNLCPSVYYLLYSQIFRQRFER